MTRHNGGAGATTFGTSKRRVFRNESRFRNLHGRVSGYYDPSYILFFFSKLFNVSPTLNQVTGLHVKSKRQNIVVFFCRLAPSHPRNLERNRKVENSLGLIGEMVQRVQLCVYSLFYS